MERGGGICKMVKVGSDRKTGKRRKRNRRGRKWKGNRKGRRWGRKSVSVWRKNRKIWSKLRRNKRRSSWSKDREIKTKMS